MASVSWLSAERRAEASPSLVPGLPGSAGSRGDPRYSRSTGVGNGPLPGLKRDGCSDLTYQTLVYRDRPRRITRVSAPGFPHWPARRRTRRCRRAVFRPLGNGRTTFMSSTQAENGEGGPERGDRKKENENEPRRRNSFATDAAPRAVLTGGARLRGVSERRRAGTRCECRPRSWHGSCSRRFRD